MDSSNLSLLIPILSALVSGIISYVTLKEGKRQREADAQKTTSESHRIDVEAANELIDTSVVIMRETLTELKVRIDTLEQAVCKLKIENEELRKRIRELVKQIRQLGHVPITEDE
jgi:predicted ATP-grasp superfamily ATP-dependent carboligase